MKRKSVLRLSMVAVPAMTVCGLLVAASSARVDQERGTGHDDRDTKVCTDKTLRGDYGSASEGVLLNIPGLPPEAQFRGLTMTQFDGEGNLTWVEHTASMARRYSQVGRRRAGPMPSIRTAQEQL
jgi:hypothetical protein